MHYLLKITFLFVFTFITISFSMSQGEIDEQNVAFWRNEQTYGISYLSNGWGLDYRYGKRIDGYRKQLFEVGLNSIKHRKETKRTNPIPYSVSRYVFGKTNYCFDIKAGFGFQKEIFSKQDLNSISIKYYYSAGASLAFLKPIYYEIFYATYTDTSKKYEKFDPYKHRTDNILGRAPFFWGLGEIKVIPGAYLKAGTQVEYSKNDMKIKALEFGVIVNGYTNKLEIMSAVDYNPQFFVTFFLSYRFGKIINDQSKNASPNINTPEIF